MIAVEQPCLNHRLSALAKWVGTDLWVLVEGGDSPHVGSLSAGVPRDSLAAGGKRSATVSTLNMVGHMDNLVGDLFAKRLASRFSCHVSVTCGIHFDGVTAVDLETVLGCADTLLSRLEETLSKPGKAG